MPTLRQTQTAANLYLLYWQLSEGPGIDEEKDWLPKAIDQALVNNGWPKASGLMYDNEGQPMVAWHKTFDWDRWTNENHAGDINQEPMIGQAFFDYAFNLEDKITPEFLWEIAKQYNP